MALETAVRRHVEAEPPIGPGDQDVSHLRATLRGQIDRNFVRFGLPGPSDVTVNDHWVPSVGGSVRVRLYRPAAPGTVPVPVHVLVHGGGWISGSIDELVADATARHRAAAVGCVVVAVDYRLAPEFPFPTAVQDVVAVRRWLVEEAAALRIDPAQVSLGGASAGANVAVGSMLAAPEPAVVAVVLEVPALDLTLRTAQAAVADMLAEGVADGMADGMARAVDEMRVATRHYLGEGGDPASPVASPLLAPDLSGMPPTFVLTAGLDPLRREGESFAARLSEAGVPVRVERYDGALHGSSLLTAVWPTARRWHDDVLTYLRAAHQPAGQPGTTQP
jgi:acetyl esterase